MHPHKLRPGSIRLVEEGQVGAMRVRAPGSDEDGADVRVVGEVGGESNAHGPVRIAAEGKVVVRGGRGDEGVDGRERVQVGDVD